MPVRPPVFRSSMVQGDAVRKRAHDERRREGQPWRAWYKLPVWQAIRRAQLAKQPLCENCFKAGRFTPATVCHHKEAHKGDWNRFIAGPFESACEHCHNADIQRAERAGG